MPKRKTPEKPMCVICMSTVKNKANIDSCKHEFCRKCIVKWAETENSCPCCRKKFNKVSTEKSTKKVENKRQRPDPHGDEGPRDLFLDLLVKFITDDHFKIHLASQFLMSTPPVEAIIMANWIRRGLCNPEFSQWIDRDAPVHAREEYYCARQCIETMFQNLEESRTRSTSIAI